jgi:hypothetical protein
MRHILSTRFVLPLALTLFAAAPAPAQQEAQQEDADVLERGRELTEAFYQGELAEVVEAFNDDMRSALGGVEGLDTFRDQVLAQLGTETEVLDEQVTSPAGHRVYQRSARFERGPGSVVVLWAFDGDGRVAGFSIRPEQGEPEEAPTRHLDYRTKTPLRLPFDDEWTVVWGGRTVDQNYHAAHVDQRFAYDLLVVADGSRHTSAGAANEDYHCFRRPVLAPGPGTVAVVRDGVADNTPGEMNPGVPPGNHVVLDHGNGEYSFLAHFQEGTLRVAVGDTVAPGDTLGLCGNSGNSSEPHLHYHLQDTPTFGKGEGLPTQFLDYLADDEPVARGEPVQGQRIRPAGLSR